MGGSTILTQSGSSEAVRKGVRVRLWVGRVMRVAGGLVRKREEMGRRWRLVDRRTVSGRMVCMGIRWEDWISRV